MNSRKVFLTLYINVFTCDLLCTSLVGANTGEPEIDAVSAILIDATTGTNTI